MNKKRYNYLCDLAQKSCRETYSNYPLDKSDVPLKDGYDLCITAQFQVTHKGQLVSDNLRRTLSSVAVTERSLFMQMYNLFISGSRVAPFSLSYNGMPFVVKFNTLNSDGSINVSLHPYVRDEDKRVRVQVRTS